MANRFPQTKISVYSVCSMVPSTKSFGLMNRLFPLAFFFILSLLLCAPAFADDWPHLLGPSRDGSTATLPKTLSAPLKGWTAEAGQGFPGPVVAGGQVFIFDRKAANERLRCLEAKTGTLQWTATFPASYRGTINPDSGPRATPVVNGGRVYLLGAAGHVHAVNQEDGSVAWSRDMGRDVDADEGYFGLGQTPLLLDGKLLLNLGGEAGAGLVALDVATGKTAWKSTESGPSYSATIPWNGNAIAVTRLETLAIQPDGKVLWSVPFGKKGPTVNGAAPLLVGNTLFLTASYGIGARAFKLGGPGGPGEQPALRWQSDEAMSSQYPTPVCVNGHLYGIHGREDYNNGEFRCVDLATGAVRWTRPEFPMAQSVTDGERILTVTLDGKLLLHRANPARFDPIAEARIGKGIFRSYPARADGFLFVVGHPDDGRDGTLHAIQL